MVERKLLTDKDERLLAKDIVIMLTQKGVSYAQAERILEMVDNEIRNTPISDISEEPFVPTDSSGTKYPVGGIAIPRPSDIHEHNQ